MSNTLALPRYGFLASTNSIVTCPKEEKSYLTIMMKMEFVEITSASYLAQDTCTIRGGGEGRTKSLNSSAQLVHCSWNTYGVNVSPIRFNGFIVRSLMKGHFCWCHFDVVFLFSFCWPQKLYGTHGPPFFQ